MVTTTARFRVTRDEEPGVPRVENVRTSPAEVKAGETFTVGYQLRNDGAGPMTGGAVIEFDCAGAVCMQPKTMAKKTVQAKGSAQESAQFTMPANAVPGTYAVRVRYDQDAAGNATATTTRSTFVSKNATIS